MSATEQMRAMLDGLMGTARDGSDSQRQHTHFTDPRVCRAFLLDCCPHDIFVSTKLELGECPKIHDYALRADYLQANKTEDFMYEVSALDRLQTFVSEADKKTEYLKRRLAETQEELTAEETNKLNRVHELTEKLGKKLAQVDKAEADNDMEAKQKFSEEAERIKKERNAAEAEYRLVSKPTSSHQQQNLRVCDICSAYLGINDNDSRLADHYGGKLHLGFITVREKLEDLKKIVAEKRSSSTRVGPGPHNDRSNAPRNISRDRDYDYDYDRGTRDYDRGSRSRDYDMRDRYRDRNRYRERDERDRMRNEPRYLDRNRERSRSGGRYYRDDRRDSRTRDRYPRDDRADRPDRYDVKIDRSDKSDRHDSIISSRAGDRRGAFDRADAKYSERDITYQRTLREWEKREAERAKKYAIRLAEEQDRKLLEEQESKKLKEFLEDYKDERDDIRFYRSSALSRRLADRRKEIEQDELARQKEKMELEMLSRSCAIDDLRPQPIECANSVPSVNANPTNGDTGAPIASDQSIVQSESLAQNFSSTSSNQQNPEPQQPPQQQERQEQQEQLDEQGEQEEQEKQEEQEEQSLQTQQSSQQQSASNAQNKSASEDKKRQVGELIGRIPTDKDQLFAKQLDWSLLDENLMEKRIRPWVTKKIAEYMGEKEVDLIDFVCTLLSAHTDGSSMLREVAMVLDDEAEKFVVHLWRLLIFELEAKKVGLRK